MNSNQYPQKSVLDVEVSLFSSCKDTNPTKVNLLHLLQSNVYKEKVEALRQIENPERRDEAKKMLPGFTPSGLFSKREASSLISHSGLIGIDIDYKENLHISNFLELKEQISKLPTVAYCGLSVSGKGFWCLVPIKDPEKHREHFLALEKAFEFHEITVDAACKDVSRLRFCSYDPDAYFNHSAKIFFKTPTLSTPPTLTALPNYILEIQKEEEKVIQCIQQIERKGVDITSTYRAWFEIACSLANTFGEHGRELFHRISRNYSKYDYTETDRKFTSCLRSAYDFSLGTFFYYCKLEGVW
jgi:hypothetical protein